jgi:hypothetical protein
MWQEYFKVVKIKPGRVNTALFGLIDFSQPNIPLEKIVALYESDFPYLEITPKGMEAIYITGKPSLPTQTGLPAESITEKPSKEDLPGPIIEGTHFDKMPPDTSQKAKTTLGNKPKKTKKQGKNAGRS